jgi:bifunctional non-homologous end joining protein LigD
MGTIEFHIWGARSDDLEKPDRLVFDLDPDEGLPFSKAVDAARELGDMLGETGLAAMPMLTGGKGIHVICPLRRKAEWKTVTLFARGVATYFADRKPERFVDTMSKARRRGRIFIDWMRNERGATAIAPYSLRARDGGPVALPVRWNELAGIKSAKEFGVGDAIGRLSEPCPLLETPRDQSIGKTVVAKLERLVA